MILWSQVINGVLLPFVLIYMVLLINKRSLMKEWTYSTAYNAVAWAAVVIMIGLTLTLASITVKQLTQHPGTAVQSPSRPLAEVQRNDPGGHSLKPHVRESGLTHMVR